MNNMSISNSVSGRDDLGPENFLFTGPETLVGRYLRLFWHPVFLSRNLPTGRAKPVKIMNEDFTLYR